MPCSTGISAMQQDQAGGKSALQPHVCPGANITHPGSSDTTVNEAC